MAGDIPSTHQSKCTDFQNASFLRGTNLRVQFLLFTLSDPSCGQLVEENTDLQNSGFNVTLGTKLLIHGFSVIVLGVSESSIHIIGVSLGAHVGGMVGHFYKGQLGRITGLDPAGPEYTRASLEERLDAGDALFVEAIHTDTDNLGIRIPVGHVDYFVNGGQDQPGCPTFIHAGYSYLICDHMRAVHLYISALENPCPLMAFPCASYKDFLAGQCLDCLNPFLLSCPRIGLLEQGGVKIEPLPKEVRVYLLTTSRDPYCVQFFIDVQLIDSNYNNQLPKQQLRGKGIIAHPQPQCQINQVKLKLQASNRVWRKDRTTIVGKFCTAPLPVNDSKKMVCLPQPVTLQASVTVFHDLKIACV
ncbi:phospholipase A1 member A [Orycteropus afer afer]|uniref:Phospholipase A1 member A n=1 Tax=Orycteropus afer afer TaxID=1230840 RepID=A0A8B7A2F7_ORYAF|nr:phospholipase A1 member A [Orycteropus afer afer]